MLKLTKTGIGLLTKQYRSVLRKCLLLNFGVLILIITNPKCIPQAYAMVEGYNVAIGTSSEAGSVSVSVGYSAKANNYGSVALGIAADASGYASISMGHYASASESGSVALGTNSSSVASNAVALGAESVANNSYTVSVGSSSIKRRIVNVAAGTADNDVVILKQLNDALNYYYTFRVDEISETAEFALFLNNEKLSSVFEV